MTAAQEIVRNLKEKSTQIYLDEQRCKKDGKNLDHATSEIISKPLHQHYKSIIPNEGCPPKSAIFYCNYFRATGKEHKPWRWQEQW